MALKRDTEVLDDRGSGLVGGEVKSAAAWHLYHMMAPMAVRRPADAADYHTDRHGAARRLRRVARRCWLVAPP
jgi:hypothetical protein